MQKLFWGDLAWISTFSCKSTHPQLLQSPASSSLRFVFTPRRASLGSSLVIFGHFWVGPHQGTCQKKMGLLRTLRGVPCVPSMRRDTWCSAVISITQHLSPSLRVVNSHLIPSQDGKCSCLMNFLQSHLGRFKTTPPAAGRGVINDGCGLEQSRTKGTRLLQRGASSAVVSIPCSSPKTAQLTVRGPISLSLGGEVEVLQQIIWGLCT